MAEPQDGKGLSLSYCVPELLLGEARNRYTLLEM